MDDKGIQVAIGLKRCRGVTSTGSQTRSQTPEADRATQCGTVFTGSYGRNRQHVKWRYDNLVALMQDKEILIHWLINEGLISKKQFCPMCGEEMNLRRCEDRSDGLKWKCKRQENGKRHKAEISIRKGSWFEKS